MASDSIMENFRQEIGKLLLEIVKPDYKHAHLKRVYQMAKHLDANSACDDDILFSSSMLHDIGTYPKFRPSKTEELEEWDHVSFACDFAANYLNNIGFVNKKIPLVVKVIKEHTLASKPESTEAIVVRDADLLDFLGSIGIARILIRVGTDTRTPDIKSAISWIEKNLKTIPESLITARAKQIASKRKNEMVRFLDLLKEETENLDLI